MHASDHNSGSLAPKIVSTTKYSSIISANKESYIRKQLNHDPQTLSISINRNLDSILKNNDQPRSHSQMSYSTEMGECPIELDMNKAPKELNRLDHLLSSNCNIVSFIQRTRSIEKHSIMGNENKIELMTNRAFMNFIDASIKSKGYSSNNAKRYRFERLKILGKALDMFAKEAKIPILSLLWKEYEVLVNEKYLFNDDTGTRFEVPKMNTISKERKDVECNQHSDSNCTVYIKTSSRKVYQPPDNPLRVQLRNKLNRELWTSEFGFWSDPNYIYSKHAHGRAHKTDAIIWQPCSSILTSHQDGDQETDNVFPMLSSTLVNTGMKRKQLLKHSRQMLRDSTSYGTVASSTTSPSMNNKKTVSFTLNETEDKIMNRSMLSKDKKMIRTHNILLTDVNHSSMSRMLPLRAHTKQDSSLLAHVSRRSSITLTDGVTSSAVVLGQDTQPTTTNVARRRRRSSIVMQRNPQSLIQQLLLENKVIAKEAIVGPSQILPFRYGVSYNELLTITGVHPTAISPGQKKVLDLYRWFIKAMKERHIINDDSDIDSDIDSDTSSVSSLRRGSEGSVDNASSSVSISSSNDSCYDTENAIKTISTSTGGNKKNSTNGVISKREIFNSSNFYSEVKEKLIKLDEDKIGDRPLYHFVILSIIMREIAFHIESEASTVHLIPIFMISWRCFLIIFQLTLDQLTLKTKYNDSIRKLQANTKELYKEIAYFKQRIRMIEHSMESLKSDETKSLDLLKHTQKRLFEFRYHLNEVIDLTRTGAQSASHFFAILLNEMENEIRLNSQLVKIRLEVFEIQSNLQYFNTKYISDLRKSILFCHHEEKRKNELNIKMKRYYQVQQYCQMRSSTTCTLISNYKVIGENQEKKSKKCTDMDVLESQLSPLHLLFLIPEESLPKWYRPITLSKKLVIHLIGLLWNWLCDIILSVHPFPEYCYNVDRTSRKNDNISKMLRIKIEQELLGNSDLTSCFLYDLKYFLQERMSHCSTTSTATITKSDLNDDFVYSNDSKNIRNITSYDEISIFARAAGLDPTHSITTRILRVYCFFRASLYAHVKRSKLEMNQSSRNKTNNLAEHHHEGIPSDDLKTDEGSNHHHHQQQQGTKPVNEDIHNNEIQLQDAREFVKVIGYSLDLNHEAINELQIRIKEMSIHNYSRRTTSYRHLSMHHHSTRNTHAGSGGRSRSVVVSTSINGGIPNPTIPIDRLVESIFKYWDSKIIHWFRSIKDLIRLSFNSFTKLHVEPYTFQHYRALVKYFISQQEQEERSPLSLYSSISSLDLMHQYKYAHFITLKHRPQNRQNIEVKEKSIKMRNNDDNIMNKSKNEVASGLGVPSHPSTGVPSHPSTAAVFLALESYGYIIPLMFTGKPLSTWKNKSFLTSSQKSNSKDLGSKRSSGQKDENEMNTDEETSRSFSCVSKWCNFIREKKKEEEEINFNHRVNRNKNTTDSTRDVSITSLSSSTTSRTSSSLWLHGDSFMIDHISNYIIDLLEYSIDQNEATVTLHKFKDRFPIDNKIHKIQNEGHHSENTSKKKSFTNDEIRYMEKKISRMKENLDKVIANSLLNSSDFDVDVLLDIKMNIKDSLQLCL